MSKKRLRVNGANNKRFSYLLLSSFLATVIMLSLASPCACYLPEDVNHDGRVDMDDILAAKEAYGYQSGSKYWNPNVDVVLIER